MKDTTQSMVFASLAADSLSLAAHWIYDTDKIDSEIGLVDHLQKPQKDSYHANKKKGDFTHYGDQTLLLLKHLNENDGFELRKFADKWQKYISNYNGYIDKATQSTLQALQDGKSPDQCGSNSSDLGGPARIAPLFHWYATDGEKLLEKAFEQTAFTHKGAGTAAATEFLVKATLLVLDGKSPTDAIEQVIDEGINDIDLDMRLRNSIESTADDTRKAISQFGQMCATSAALPGAVHLILNYQENLREALIQNVMAGGDSAARGLVVGMILGAYQGIDGLDRDWLKEMRATNEIEQLLIKGS